MKKTVESTYQRSFTSYEKTEEPVNKTEEVPVHQYTFPVSERIEEEKPTITVHRSRQQEEGMCVLLHVQMKKLVLYSLNVIWCYQLYISSAQGPITTQQLTGIKL